MTPLKIISLNVRGLRDNEKCTNVFEWLHMNKYDIILLQETYIYCKRDTDIICREWGSPLVVLWYLSEPGDRHPLLPIFPGQNRPNQIITDHAERILSVTIDLNETSFQVCNVYCPTDGTECCEFLNNLPTYIKGGTP